MDQPKQGCPYCGEMVPADFMSKIVPGGILAGAIDVVRVCRHCLDGEDYPTRQHPLIANTEALSRIQKLLQEQDNCATADPIYVVQQKRRIYGFDADEFSIAGCDAGVEWVSAEDDDADDAEREYLDKFYGAHGAEPDGWRRVGYVDIWDFVQPFFTMAAAGRYIDENRHNLKQPRVYVESGYRNTEWQLLRSVLAGGVVERSEYKELERRHRARVEDAKAEASIDHCDGYGGWGWYWWDTEYPEEGATGPISSCADAVTEAFDSNHVITDADVMMLAVLVDDLSTVLFDLKNAVNQEATDPQARLESIRRLVEQAGKYVKHGTE